MIRTSASTAASAIVTHVRQRRRGSARVLAAKLTEELGFGQRPACPIGALLGLVHRVARQPCLDHPLQRRHVPRPRSSPDNRAPLNVDHGWLRAAFPQHGQRGGRREQGAEP